MVEVEICIQAESAQSVRRAVAAAREGGAQRVELCAAMQEDGLTPRPLYMRLARQAFAGKPGLMVMVRPRGGNFCYQAAEIRQMRRQIEQAAQAGADGVVLGVLRENRAVDEEALGMLVTTARAKGLQVTFHRAFDAAVETEAALEALVTAGVQRVLTAGIPWGQKGSAVDGLSRLRQTIGWARGRIEVIVAGGVNPGNAPAILSGLEGVTGPFSLHAYSGAQENGQTTRSAVEKLVKVVGYNIS